MNEDEKEREQRKKVFGQKIVEGTVKEKKLN